MGKHRVLFFTAVILFIVLYGGLIVSYELPY